MKKLLFFGGLGGGLYLYDSNSRSTQVKSNIKFNSTQIEQLKTLNKSSGEFIHKKSTFDNSDRKKVVIIGGGIIGVSTAYYLLKSDKFDVVLVERNKDISLETSFGNGYTMVPCKSEPWIGPSYLPKVWSALRGKEQSLQFHSRMFYDKFSVSWCLNALLACNEKSYQQGLVSCLKLSHLTRLEFNALLKEIPASKIDHSETYQHVIYGKNENEKKLKESYDKKAKIIPIDYQILKSTEEIISHEPALANLNFDGQIVTSIKNEYNVNVPKLSNELMAKCIDNPRFKLLTDTNANQWVLNDENQVVGLGTSNGIILGDEFVVAGAYWTKFLIWKLGVKVPIIAAKGHSMTFDIPDFNIQQNGCYFDIETSIMHTQVGNKIRMAGLVDFMGDTMKILPNRKEQLIKSAEKYYRYSRDSPAVFWSGLRPISSDDVPIIGQLNSTFPNVHINSGHGSKGITWGLGSGRLMASILTGEDVPEVKKEDYILKRFFFI